jgi:hypothetical protein
VGGAVGGARLRRRRGGRCLLKRARLAAAIGLSLLAGASCASILKVDDGSYEAADTTICKQYDQLCGVDDAGTLDPCILAIDSALASTTMQADPLGLYVSSGCPSAPTCKAFAACLDETIFATALSTGMCPAPSAGAPPTCPPWECDAGTPCP